MPWNKKHLKICLALLLSGLAFWQYMEHRNGVFPISAEPYRLEHRFSPDEVRQIAEPFINLQYGELKYKVDTFVDRNSLKFLQVTSSEAEFERVLKTENLPLWGWTVDIESPVHAQLKISYKKKLTGFETDARFKSRNAATKDLLTQLELGTEKKLPDYVENVTESPGDRQELKFRKKIPGTNLVEIMAVDLEKGNFRKFDSTLLLPVSYATGVNSEIEKQKTLHQFFNIFHYTLIALIFLFLFRAYENHDLRWRKNIRIFLILFFLQTITYLFKTDFHGNYILSIFQSLIKATGHTAWMFGLIVAADFVARTFSKSSYSLSNLGKPSFLTSGHFRSGLLAGWLLFVWQLIIVGIFYKVFLHYSAYVPMKIPGEHSIYCSFEFLRYFADSMSTAMYEEILYRLFLICFFALLFRKTWPAIIISSILWGFLHFSYQFEPYYIRGLELTLVGLFYGWAMVRYGILSVITAHFLYNSFILSDYENQATPYFLGVCLTLVICYVASRFFEKRMPPFVFERAEFLKRNINVPAFVSDRRNILRKIRPLSWKFGLGILLLMIGILSRIHVGFRNPNPLTNRDALVEMSSGIVSSYTQKDVWNITFHRDNPDIEKLVEAAKKNPDKKTIFKIIEPYSFLWSIRYFSGEDSHVVCEMDYSHEYELMRMYCPEKSDAGALSFEEWVRLVKAPSETWTLLDTARYDNGIANYQYLVVSSSPSVMTRKASVRFKNDRLVYFKKQIEITGLAMDAAPPQEKGVDFASIGLSIIFVGLIFGFVRFFAQVAKNRSVFDKKSARGAAISGGLYVLWKINAYKEALIDSATNLSIRHLIVNELLFLCLKTLVLCFASYLLFFAFFEFPSRIFKHVPRSAEWNGILSRPVWKWRNAKVSLLYAVLLLCIQTLLGLLIQMSSGFSSLDLFHFDISFLNHEYVFITFLGLLWKNLLFWIALMVVISILEHNFPRWIYLPILCFVVLLNVSLSHASLDAKLIELCATYIVFYFVYNIARFDFAFYFWFVLFNSMLTFAPLMLYKQYQPYLYQVVFIFIFVLTVVAYTLIRGTKKIDGV